MHSINQEHLADFLNEFGNSFFVTLLIVERLCTTEPNNQDYKKIYDALKRMEAEYKRTFH